MAEPRAAQPETTGPYPEGRPPLIKRVLPRSLLGRAMLIVVTPVVLVQAIAAYVFFERHYDTTTRRLAQALVDDIAVTLALLEDRRLALSRADVFALANQTMRLDLGFMPGAGLPAGLPPAGETILDRRLRTALAERIPYPTAASTWARPETVRIWVAMPDGRLTVTVPRKRLFSVTTYLLVFWTVGTGVLFVAVALIFMRNQVRPIRRLAVAAERFGKGLDVPQFRPRGAREVRQAAAAFIQMRRRVERQIQQRTDMLSGVSHDLRTPLTRMKLELAMLDDTPAAESLRRDVAEMERMVAGYLAFARGEGTETPANVPVADLLADAAGPETLPVEVEAPPALTATVRREAMRRALGNLIANARRHATTVRVTAQARPGHVAVCIDDDGPGIPASRREDAFRPFVRMDDSRNPDTGGTGLGLTIARDIVRGHGGELHLSDSPLGGLQALVLLPAAPNAD